MKKWAIVLAIATTPLSAACIEDVLARINTSRWDEIEPGLFLTEAPRNRIEILKHQIEVILQAAYRHESPDYPPEIVTSHRFEFRDWDFTNAEALQRAAWRLAWERKLGKRVLVHCVQGISRSPTLVALYLMAKHGWGWNQAVDYLKAIRPCVYPRPNLIADQKRIQIAAELRAILDGSKRLVDGVLQDP